VALLPGSKLAFYEILGPLGAGAMGEVYRAKDTRLEREVAIKVLPEHFADDPERLKRFEREAKTLASLNHPNVAQIHGVDQVGDTCFLVLELVPGEALEERIRRGPLPIDEALDVCRQIAAGLEAAHEAGVIHRDLKPANVRLTPDGKVKVLDFGLAKPARESGSSQSSTDSVLSTEAGRLLGTPTYMAPEQARGKNIDKRVDIWAFGCVLYECLTAKRAFAGETLTDVFAAVIEREPDWSRLPDATPARVREFLRVCLAKDRRQRLHDIGDARLELERALTGSPEGRGTAARKSGWSLAAVGIAALLLGAAGAWRLIPREAGARAEAPGVLRLSMALPESPRATGALTLSQDGKTLAYVAVAKDATGDKVNQIWLRRIDSFQPTLLAGTDGARSMCFSPDDRWIAFVCPIPGSSGTGDRLKKVPLSGGPPITLCEDRKSDFGVPEWTPSGTIEFFRRSPDPEIATVSSDGGEPRRLLEFPGASEDSASGSSAIPGTDARLVSLAVTDAKGWRVRTNLLSPRSPIRVMIDDGAYPQFLPPGVVLYASGDTLLARRFDAGTCDWVGGAVPILSGLRTTQGYSSNGWRASASCLAYLPGGQIAGKRRLATVDPSGKIETLSPIVGDFEQVALPSPDGTMIAGLWVTPDGNYEPFVYDLAGGTVRRLSVRGADCSPPAWSRDGKSLYGGWSVTGKPVRITVRRADGMDSPRTVCEMPADLKFVMPVGELNDGKHLMVVGGATNPDWKTTLELVPLDGAGTPTLLYEVALPVGAQLSPDGRWLLYGQVDQGTNEVIIRRAPSGAGDDESGSEGERAVVLTEGGLRASWSPDGKKIVFTEKSLRLMEVSVTTEPTLSVSRPREITKIDLTDGGSLPIPLPGTDKLVFVQNSPEETKITQVNLVMHWYEDLESKLPPAPSR
jgi:Tol biopolymer transport system component